jgi:hypothetical protein
MYSSRLPITALWGIVDQEPITMKVDISVQDGSWRKSLVSQFPLCACAKIWAPRSLVDGEVRDTRELKVLLKDY